MKTTLSKPAPAKSEPKTPTRRTKPTAPTEAPAAETATATEAPPPETPPAPIPSLTATFGAPLKIIFQDLGNKEVVSDIPGGFTLAKRLAMAYAVASRTTSSYTGVACGDLASAFTIISFDPKGLCVTACLVTSTPTMEFPCADLKFAAPDSSRVRLVAPERSAIARICYSDLPRVSTSSDCPHCGEYIFPRDFTWQETSDAGERQVARCSSCGTMMKKRL